MKDKRTIGALVALALIFFVTVGAVGAQVAKERIKWLVADKATFLEGGVEFYSDVSFGDGVMLLDDGTAAAPGLAWTSDSDTGFYRPADNQMGVSFAGTAVQTWKEFGSSTVTTDTTTNLWEIADTTNVMTGGTNSLAAVNVDLAIGNSTGGTNNVYGVLIDSITQDAQNTETAIAIGNGWDRGLDMDGNSIYLDNDQDTIIAEASDDKISFTPGAAAGGLNILTGNLWVGNGTPDSTPNGEDAYVEGGLEVDGQTRLDGNGYVPDDGLLAFGASNDAYFWYDETTSDEFKLTIAAAAGGLEVQVGNVWIGNGTPGTAAMDGEDLYIEGDLEADGTVTLDGAVTVNNNATITGTLGVGGATTLSGVATVNNNLIVTGTSDLQGDISDSGGTLTIADNAAITGTADLQGDVSDSGGNLTFADNVVITGTTDAQGDVSDSGGDYTIADNAVITGTGTFGLDFTVTDAFSVTQATGNTDVAGTLQYGADNLYPMGFATSGYAMYCGNSATITDTSTILSTTHGLQTSVVSVMCSLGTDPGTGAGDAVACSSTISNNDVTFKGWQDDWTAAANAWTLYYCIVGQP